VKITITGKSSKVSSAEIREAVRWYAAHLMGPRLARNINLRIVLKRGLRQDRNIWAECDCRDRGPRPRNFTIRIEADASRTNVLTTLAHEMVHVKQFARRELIEVETNRVFKWYDDLYGKETHYYDQPWEIEAHGREYGLYHMWREDRPAAARR
jgi:hypothetical protein